MIQIKKKNLFTDSIFSSILEVFHKSNVFSSIDEKASILTRISSMDENIVSYNLIRPTN